MELTDKKEVLFIIEDGKISEPGIKRIYEISNSNRKGLETAALKEFLEYLVSSRDKNSKYLDYILDKEFWIEKNNEKSWEWVSYEFTKDRSVIKIRHTPLSNYVDLIHLLIYIGVDLDKVKVEDELFGSYRMIDLVPPQGD